MIRLSKPYFDKQEIKAVEETLASGWVAGQGPKGIKLSEQVKSLTETKYAIPLNSCTAGLHLSLLAVGIKPGDEVLVSDYTFPATGHAIMYCGATPKFVDVNIRSYNMDPNLIEEKINNKTKAIVVVHVFGQVADMVPILNIAKKHNLKLIEDAACAMGAKYKGNPAGSFGDIASFSFHARKNATCGEGGIVVTNNECYADIVSSLSCFGIDSAFKRQNEFAIPSFTALGYNYKLSDINASIAYEQLKKYPDTVERKRTIAALYNNLLENNEFISIPYEAPNNYHIYQTYAITLDKRINRDKLILSLKSEGIQTQIGTYASHIQPVYNSKDKCPNSLFLFRQSLALPLYYELSEKQSCYVAEKLNYHINKQISGK